MQQIKQRGVNFLRQLGMLPAAEQMHFLWTSLRERRENALFLHERPDFTPPPLAVMHDAYGSVSFQSYWDGGHRIAQLVADTIQRHHPSPRHILEWGCGAARVLRHLPSFFPPEVEFSGTDYNPKSIAWCRTAVPHIRFADNGLAPPLPFAARQFDVVYAVSVLTHLSTAQQVAWLRELRRVLAPKGILVLTLHGIRSTQVLLPQEFEHFEQKGTLVRNGVEEGKRCFVSYHHPKYARDVLFRGLAVSEHITDHPFITQDVWVVREPEAMASTPPP